MTFSINCTTIYSTTRLASRYFLTSKEKQPKQKPIMHNHLPISLLPLLLPTLCLSREITFPPIAAYHAPNPSSHHNQQYQAQLPLAHALEGIDLATGSAFSGLTTFANLPHVHCLSDKEVERYDVAFLGAPFDTVGAFLFVFGVCFCLTIEPMFSAPRFGRGTELNL